MFQKRFWLITLSLLLALVMASCAQSPEPTAEVEATPCPACPDPVACPDPTPCPEGVSFEIPYEEMWANSPHAALESEAFAHWNGEDPAVVPASCAKCHSSSGMADFLGADGSAAGAVDADVPVGTTVECATCHNPGTEAMTSVVFPSGAEITGLGREAVCMQCHQGRASKVQVDAAIEKAGVTDEDTPVAELGFVNIHYFAAAVSRYGSQVQGGYEYEGKTYDVLFEHVPGYDSCTDCHNPHSLELEIASCTTCHEGVTTVEDLRDIRFAGSLTDYDGDGDLAEGMYYEIDGVRTVLYSAIQAYAAEVAGSPIVYNAAAYPYWFIDANADGATDDGDTERFASWTARLEKAAYNYQTSLKDGGAYAHGGKYMIQLMYDSIENLNMALSEQIDISMMHRIDAGHFAGSTEAFRHWDAEEGIVPGSCARCHTAGGLPMFLTEGVNISTPASNGFLCETCHTNTVDFTLYTVEEVTFPSGAKLSLDNPTNNLCLTCHQGRSSKVAVDRAIAGLDKDTVNENLRFLNIHYFAAGATLFGSEAQGIYQFDGKEYAGRFMHVATHANCSDCHGAHELTVQTDECLVCHGVDDVDLLRAPGDVTDYDGDGDTAEGIKGEVETLNATLLATLQEYVVSVGAPAIGYNSHAHPYFFVDTNADGVIGEDETDRYASFTPASLIGAYNYQYVSKDPGAFTHNGKYTIQVLIDTIEYLGGDISTYTRP